MNTKDDHPSSIENVEKSMNFNDALVLTEFGKFNYFLIIVSGFTMAAQFVETGCVSMSFPFAECDLDLTTARMGVLGSAGFFGVLICLPISGYLADKFGRLPVLKYALLIEFVIANLSAFANSFWLFILLRFLNGCFLPPSLGIIFAYIGEFHTSHYRDRVIMFASVVLTLVTFLVPIAAYFVINYSSVNFEISFIGLEFKPWRLFLVVCSIPGGLSAVAFMFMPESPKFLLAKEKEQEAIEVLKTVYKLNTGRCKSTFEVQHITDIISDEESVKFSALERCKLIFSKQYIRATSILCFLQFSIGAVSIGAFTWMLLITNRVMSYNNSNPDANMLICDIINENRYINVNETIATPQIEHEPNSTTCIATTKLEVESIIAAALLELILSVGFFVIGILIKYTGKFPIQFSLAIGTGICGILVVYLPNPILALSMYVIYLCPGLLTPIMNASTVNIFPIHLRALALSLTVLMSRAGAAAGANLSGQLLDNYCELTFVVPGCVLIFCGFVSFFIPNIFDKKNKKEVF